MAYFKNHKYLKTVNIDVSEELNCEDANIKFREPTTEEAFKLRADDEEQAVQAFKDLLPSLIVDSTFYEDEENMKKMDAKDIVEIIYSSFSAFQKVLTAYTSQVFRSDRDSKEAD